MQRITLAKRPVGAPKDEDFFLEAIPTPEPKSGEVLVEIEYLSLDPYMRGRMDDAKSYAEPVALGDTMEGTGVGRVVASKSDKFAVGDYAFGQFGWASHGCLPDNQMRKVDPNLAPLTTSLGVLGMPGFTGWYGFNELGRPKEGETLVVGAATGPVGSMVGQLAKAQGLRAVGIAGGAEKCKLAVEKFGFDHCLDHRSYDTARALKTDLKRVCTEGIDIYFENIAGMTLDAVLPLMNQFGRIPICGMISWYNEAPARDMPRNAVDKLPKMWRSILVKQMSVNGFIISNHWDRYGEFLTTVAPLVRAGKVSFQEDIVTGLENAPRAFMGLLEGKNFGKLIVKLG